MLWVYVGGFGIGVLSHMLDFVRGGWQNYAFAPDWIAAYWSALLVLDAAVIVLLLRARAEGVVLAVAIMTSDVAINTYARYGLGIQMIGPALVVQSLFGGFVLGSAPFLWRALRRGG